MKIINYSVLIKPDETSRDIIAELCDEGDVGPDEPFVFSGIMTPTSEPGFHQLKLNCLVPREQNPFTISEFIKELYGRKAHNAVKYVQPPLDKWLECFRPMLLNMVERVYPIYMKLLKERDEMLSILYYTVVTLYNKGYYIHKTLIYKCFINNLNLECRKLKHFQNCVVSIDECEVDRYGDTIPLVEKIADEHNVIEEQEDEDERRALFEWVKSIMLQDMSEFKFKRILTQLSSKTVDTGTMYILKKYRKRFKNEYERENG